MRTIKLKLGRPDLGLKIEQRYRREKDARSKTRLLCVKLAAEGSSSAEQIAGICGCSRASVFEWMKVFRSGGFQALLERDKPGPRSGERRGLSEKASRELDEGVDSGRWASAESARQ